MSGNPIPSFGSMSLSKFLCEDSFLVTSGGNPFFSVEFTSVGEILFEESFIEIPCSPFFSIDFTSVSENLFEESFVEIVGIPIPSFVRVSPTEISGREDFVSLFVFKNSYCWLDLKPSEGLKDVSVNVESVVAEWMTAIVAEALVSFLVDRASEVEISEVTLWSFSPETVYFIICKTY